METSTGDAHRVGTLGAPLHGGARDFFAEQLYEAISHAFVALDRHWRIVQVNSRAGAILGREPASLIGRHVWSEFPEAIGRPFYYACERAVATSTPLLTDGCFAPWECRCTSRLYPSAGGLLILFAEDNATDARRMHGVQQSRYLRAILDTAPECIKVVRRDGALLDMNRAGLSLIEAPSLDAVAGRCVYPMVVEHDREEFRRAIEAACDGVPALLEFEIETLGGRRRVMDSRIAPLRDQSGIVIAALCVTHDVTERRANEERLRESEARFRRLVERAPLGSYLNDADGNTIYCNPRLEAIFGRPADDIVRGAWRDAVHPDDRDRLFAGCEAFFRGNDDEMRYEYRIIRGDGATRDVVVEQVRLRTPDGRTEGYIGVTDDVTERRALEAHLRHSQKLEAVGQLAGGVAHDFNNLLTVIGNYGEFLKRELALGSAGRADLEELLGATRRAAALTRQLLTFGRRQVSVPKLLDPNMVIRGVEEMLRRLIGEHIAFVTDLDADVGCVLVDPGQLEQVIVNLAVNSRDAMPSGGLLTVETERIQLTAGDLLHPSADGGVATLVGNPGDHVVVRVTDTGLGMDDATLRRVFEPFFTTKPHGKGTGLGLPTIYGIVAQAGGSLRLRSAPGRGTTVEVYLPRHDALAAASQATEPDRPAPVVTSGRETVLVAEDEAAVRESVRRILERAGYTVIEARHGADALLLWREHREQIALVLTDVVMPEMRGTELASSVRAQAPDTKILYMSGYASEAARSDELPGATLIEKPFDAETLLRAVRASLDGVRTSAS